MRQFALPRPTWTAMLASALALALTGCPWPWAVSSTKPAPLAGRVLDSSGKPAGNVLVRASFTNAIPFTNGIPLQVADVPDPVTAEVHTSKDGRFAFPNPPQGEVNVEAVQSDDRKAVKLAIPVRSGVSMDLGDLHLAPTGTITGRVTTPSASGINLLGTDVFIPGLSYMVKTDESGAFRLSNVPAGTFRVVASNPGLGKGELPQVEVRPSEVTTLDAIPLSLNPPTITELRPAVGAAGSSFDIVGDNFGKSTTAGNTVEVYLNGQRLSDVSVESDQLIHARVPAGSQSGRVVVKVGLISGGSPGDFKVLSTLGLNPNGPALIALNGSQRFDVIATDSAGSAITNPPVSWDASPDTLVAIDGASPGTVQGRQIGSGVLHIGLGDLGARVPVFVSPLAGAAINHGTGTAAARPSVAMGSDGALVVWSALDDTSGQYLIVAQRVSGSTGTAPFSLLATFSADPKPVVAWDSWGEKFYIAYADGRIGNRQVKLQALDSSGSPVGATTISTRFNDVTGLAIATGPNEVLVAWCEPSGALNYQLRSQASGPPTTVVLANASHPSAAWDGASSTYIIAWDEVLNGKSVVKAVSAGGSGISPKGFQLVGIGNNPQRQVVLAAGAAQVIAAWSEERNGEAEIAVRPIVSGVVGSNLVYLGATHPGHGNEVTPALCWTGSHFALTWADARTDAPGVFAQLLDQDLHSGTPYALSLGAHLQAPSVTGRDTDGLVVWGQDAGGRLAIWGQRFNP